MNTKPLIAGIMLVSLVSALGTPPVPPAPELPKRFELLVNTTDPNQLQDSFRIYFETASVLGNLTNAWVARTNIPGSMTNVVVFETADLMVYRYAISNATYGRVDFLDQVVAKEAEPTQRGFQIRYRPLP